MMNYQFRLPCDFSKAQAVETEDGRWLVKLRASDTLPDRSRGDTWVAERVTKNFIKKMQTQAAGKLGKGIILNDVHGRAFGFGRVVGHESGEDDFIPVIELNKDYPEARELFAEIKAGTCRKQASIGGVTTSAYRQFDKEVGGVVKYLDDGLLDEITTTHPGKAANPRSEFLEAVQKHNNEHIPWDETPLKDAEGKDCTPAELAQKLGVTPEDLQKLAKTHCDKCGKDHAGPCLQKSYNVEKILEKAWSEEARAAAAAKTWEHKDEKKAGWQTKKDSSTETELAELDVLFASVVDNVVAHTEPAERPEALKKVQQAYEAEVLRIQADPTPQFSGIPMTEGNVDFIELVKELESAVREDPELKAEDLAGRISKWREGKETELEKIRAGDDGSQLTGAEMSAIRSKLGGMFLDENQNKVIAKIDALTDLVTGIAKRQDGTDALVTAMAEGKSLSKVACPLCKDEFVSKDRLIKHIDEAHLTTTGAEGLKKTADGAGANGNGQDDLAKTIGYAAAAAVREAFTQVKREEGTMGLQETDPQAMAEALSKAKPEEMKKTFIESIRGGQGSSTDLVAAALAATGQFNIQE